MQILSPVPGSEASSTQKQTFVGAGVTVGVFDSGLGGLSVMQAIQHLLPQARMIYVADSGHAPYGERDDEFIRSRASLIVDFLLGHGAQILVVACNTATAAAIAELRRAWPAQTIIGIEPGVKPAVQSSRHGRIGVLATPATINSQKFKALVDTHASHVQVTLQPCPGLAGEIERGQLDSPRLREMVAQFCLPLQQANVDTAVLGCTHYPLIRPLFEEVLGPDVHLVDTAQAVARHTARLAQVVAGGKDDQAMVATEADPQTQVQLYTTGQAQQLARIAQCWLGLEVPVQTL